MGLVVEVSEEMVLANSNPNCTKKNLAEAGLLHLQEMPSDHPDNSAFCAF